MIIVFLSTYLIITRDAPDTDIPINDAMAIFWFNVFIGSTNIIYWTEMFPILRRPVVKCKRDTIYAGTREIPRYISTLP